MHNRERYSFFAHTADVGLAVEGETLPQLFVHAAEGLFEYLGVPAEGRGSFRDTVSLEAPDPESLLVSWLNELLFIQAVQKVVLDSYEIRTLDGLHMAAEVSGRKILPGARALREIKAVTYHGLHIRKTRDGYRAHLIFDV